MSLNVLFSVWSGDRDLWPLWSLSECPCLGHLHWMGHVQSKINSLYELHPLHLWPLSLIWESLYFHRNWIMKRSTRRCWNQRSYLTVAECWITSMLTFRTSAFRWARGNNHLKKCSKQKWRARASRCDTSFFCLYADRDNREEGVDSENPLQRCSCGFSPRCHRTSPQKIQSLKAAWPHLSHH